MTIIQKLFNYTYAHTDRTAIDLTFSENPLGASPKAIQAIIQTAHNIHAYPSHEQDLVDLLAAHHKIDSNNIILGAGANQLIDDALKTYALNKGIVVPSATFPESIASITTLGGFAKTVPLKPNFNLNLEDMLSAIDSEIALIHLCNPNNPTGIWHKPAELLTLADRSSVPLLISEVGADFVGESLMNYRLHPNIIIIRSFSKSYGLAGLRIAYVVSTKEKISYLRQRLRSFGVNSLAISAAIAALQDQEHLHLSISFILKEKAYLMKAMSTLGFEVIPSQGQTFIAKIPEHFQSASDFCHRVARYGISVVDCSLYPGLELYIRISPQMHEINEQFISTLAKL